MFDRRVLIPIARRQLKMPTDPQFDLAVIGGGPAGNSTAITAARLGARVVLFEAKDFPRHKVCGEFVSAESLDILTGLLREMPSPSLIDDAPVVGRSRLFFGSRVIETVVSPAALSIPRYNLDTELWLAARATGVETRANCAVTAVEGDAPFHLQTAMGDVTARSLVIAAGRWSAFTEDRRIPPGPRWIGLKAHFRESDPSRSSDLYFFDGGYCGVQPVGRASVNVCAMVRSDRATSLPQVFRLQPRLAVRARSWTPTMDVVSTAPLIYRRPQPVRDNVLFVGDAAAFIDPFVGDGISIALRSGQVAAECLANVFSDRNTLSQAAAAYQAEYSRQFSPLLTAASRMRSLFLLPRFAKSAVFEMLRLPGLMPLVIRKTRLAA